MESVSHCPLCYRIEGKPFVPPDDLAKEWGNFFDVYSANVCQTCGTIYQNPRMTEDALKEYYSNGDYRVEHLPNLELEEKRAERLLLLIERFKMKIKSCLDVGCGRGTLLRYIEIYHYSKVLGLDWGHEPPEIDNLVHNKDDVDGKFDLITCIHVMEHMVSPVKELEWMLSKLNPGGTIILEIPTYLCNDMSHLFVPQRKGLELMLDDLDLEYLYIKHRGVCNILIGPNYSKYNVEEVFYTAESPDFSTKKEVFEWLRDDYYA